MAVRALPAARSSSWQGAIQSQCAMRSQPVSRIPLAYTFHAQSGNADLLIRSHQRMRMRNNRTSISIVAGNLCSLIPQLHLHCELPPASSTSREPPKLNDISFVRVPEASIRPDLHERAFLDGITVCRCGILWNLNVASVSSPILKPSGFGHISGTNR